MHITIHAQVEAAYVIVEGNQRAEELGELAGEVCTISIPMYIRDSMLYIYIYIYMYNRCNAVQ